MLKWNASKNDIELAAKIAVRFKELLGENEPRAHQEIEMDIIATHKNGCPLRLTDLLAAPHFDFVHDVSGIARHLDRSTGKLKGFFDPRFSVPQGKKVLSAT